MSTHTSRKQKTNADYAEEEQITQRFVDYIDTKGDEIQHYIAQSFKEISFRAVMDLRCELHKIQQKLFQLGLSLQKCKTHMVDSGSNIGDVSNVADYENKMCRALDGYIKITNINVDKIEFDITYFDVRSDDKDVLDVESKLEKRMNRLNNEKGWRLSMGQGQIK